MKNGTLGQNRIMKEWSTIREWSDFPLHYGFRRELVAPQSVDLIFEELHQHRRVRLRLQHVRLPFERAVLRVR